MSNYINPVTPELLQLNAESAKCLKALLPLGEVRDLRPAPFQFMSFHGLFKPILLGQLLSPGLTVDGAWGSLEELSLKRLVRGGLGQDDAKHSCRTLELIRDVGLDYVPVRPEWDLAHQGVLQVVDPDRLVDRFPALEPWGGRQRLFALVRSRLHELV